MRAFFTCSEADEALVAELVRQLERDERITCWFAPLHSVPGEDLQTQIEGALGDSHCCVVVVPSGGDGLRGWHNEQMRLAIQTRVEDNRAFRVLPVLLPGASAPPGLLRRYRMIDFERLGYEAALTHLRAGILGVAPSALADLVPSAASPGHPGAAGPPPLPRAPGPPIAARQAADLLIWLRRRPGGPHEALVTFRPPGSPADEYPIAGQPPAVALDPLRLLPHSLDIEAYGAALHAALFADERLAIAFAGAQGRAMGAGVPLRLRLQLDADDLALHQVRWELLCDPQRREFLCTRDQLRLARSLVSADPTPLALAPVRMAAATDQGPRPTALVAVADPQNLDDYGLAALDGAAQLAAARAALAGYAVDLLPHATLPALADRLRHGPAVLYLICHGALLEDGSSCLYLEGPDGMAAPTLAPRVAAMVAGLAVRPALIVLAACQSAGHTNAAGTGLIALGPQLARAGVGAVLAMHDSVAVDTVTAGMPILFDELRRHGGVDRAVTAMRNLLATRGDDWWQPVLYLRLRDGQLWAPAAPV